MSNNQKLYCPNCSEDVKLRSGDNGIHAVCDCDEIPLMTRSGTLNTDWGHYKPTTNK